MTKWVTVSKRGRITIPTAFRKNLGIKGKTKVTILERNNSIVVRPQFTPKLRFEP